MAELLLVSLLSLRCIHQQVKIHTESVYTYSWAVTLSMTTHLNGRVSDERFLMGEGVREKKGVDVMMKYTDCPLIDWGQGP